MDIRNWSLFRFGSACAFLCTLLVALGWAQTLVDRRRDDQVAIQRRILPRPQSFLYDIHETPGDCAFSNAFGAVVKLTAVERMIQLTAVVLLIAAAVIAWRWFDPSNGGSLMHR
jgi:hypothetical protein